MRNLMVVVIGLAVVLVLWPMVPGLPSVSSIFGGTTYTFTVNPVPREAR